MKKRSSGWLLVGAWMCGTWSSPALAVTIRYALVVGNNSGVDQDGSQPFRPLQHAERESVVLRDSLVRLASFDPSPARTLLLTGATRAEFAAAIGRIAAQKQADLRDLKHADTLFAFFFTGHGLQGRILLADGPVQASELGRLFRSVGADFNIGLFDACFSGSLDRAVLDEKGVRLTPGLNLFREMPEEVLNAEGSIWFVSSGSTQVSYEDSRLGGVFTHFFIEALERAQRDGPGISLERIWYFVRDRTVDYTSRQGRRQVPEQYVAKLKTSGPIYFSFPLERSATLVLTAPISGRFVLSYTDGQLTELIDKPAGSEHELAVFPGKARLLRVGENSVQIQAEVELAAGERLILHKDMNPPAIPQWGEGLRELWSKGEGAGELRATSRSPQLAASLGPRGRFELSPEAVVAPAWVVGLAARLDWSRLTLWWDIGYGMRREHFEKLNYTAQGLASSLRLGWGWTMGTLRFALAGGVGLDVLSQKYDSGDTHSRWLAEPQIAVIVSYPTTARWALEAGLIGGLSYLSGAGAEAGMHWRPRLGLGFTALVRLW